MLHGLGHTLPPPYGVASVQKVSLREGSQADEEAGTNPVQRQALALEAKATLRFETPPGRQSKVDFREPCVPGPNDSSHVTVRIDQLLPRHLAATGRQHS